MKRISFFLFAMLISSMSCLRLVVTTTMMILLLPEWWPARMMVL